MFIIQLLWTEEIFHLTVKGDIRRTLKISSLKIMKQLMNPYLSIQLRSNQTFDLNL